MVKHIKQEEIEKKKSNFTEGQKDRETQKAILRAE